MKPIQIAASQYDTQREFAEKLGVTPGFVSQMISGARNVPPGLCRRIEAITDGLVRAEQLRPDIYGPYQEPPRRPHE